MNKVMLLMTFFLLGISFQMKAQVPAYRLHIVTCVESMVPDGLGRSRMISTDVEVDHLEFSSRQTAEKNDRNKSDRSEIRLKEYEETKLLNFYNEGGIRIQNVVSNDALVTSKINSMLSEGWELFFVGTGVESKMIDKTIKKELLKMGIKMLLKDESQDEEKNKDPNGLFMTRYYFRKKIG